MSSPWLPIYAAPFAFQQPAVAGSHRRAASAGEQVAEAQAVGQIHQQLPVPVAGGRSPSTTGRTPPGTASVAAGSLRRRRRLFCCSECAVVARRMPSQCTAGDCFLCERKLSLSGPLQKVTGSASRWRACLTLPSIHSISQWGRPPSGTMRRLALLCIPARPTRPVLGP